MPSQKGMEQALTWLKSKKNDQDNVLDSINAEICLNVVEDLKRQLGQKGYVIHSMRNSLRREMPTKDPLMDGFLDDF